MSKATIVMDCDRTLIDFKNEVRSLYVHEEFFQRPRLSMLVNNVYIPKLKAKSFAAFLYGGESSETHSNYKLSLNEPNTVFNKADRSRDDLILGIESSFDESAASLVNSFGEVKSLRQMTMWDQWQDFDGIVPRKSEEAHIENLPKVIE